MNDTVNVPLLRKAVEWAEAEAAKPLELCEWRQSSFMLPAEYVRGAGKSPECGTCYCIAGWVAAQERDDLDWVSATSLRDGKSITEVAGEALGLDREQGWTLFASDNSIEDVRRIAESLAGERL